MKFSGVVITAALLCISVTALEGCARKKPQGRLSIYNEPQTRNRPAPPPSTPREKIADEHLTSFQKLVVALVTDSLELLPKERSNELFEAILKGIEVPDQQDQIDIDLLTKHTDKDVAFVAALVVQRIYGTSINNDLIIPQTIIYRSDRQSDHNSLAAAAVTLQTSQNGPIDAYTISLNLLVNAMSGSLLPSKRRASGVYVRDSGNNLYFQQKLPAAE